MVIRRSSVVLRAGLVLTAAAVVSGVLATPATAKPTWLPVTTLSADDDSATAADVAVGPNGDLLAVFAGTAGVQAASRKPGALWTRTTIDPGPGKEAVQVAIDDAGNALAVWQTSTAPERVRASYRPVDGQWSIPETISSPEIPSYEPKVAFDASGVATVVWYAFEGTSYRIRATERSAAGTWSTPVALSPAGPAASHPDVDVTPDGEAFAVWKGHDGSHNRIQVSQRRAGGTWSQPVYVSAPGADASSPKVSVGPQSRADIVWIRNDADRRVQNSHYVVSGWSSPSYLSDAGQHASGPVIARGKSGFAVAWRRSDGTNERAQVRLRDQFGWTSAHTVSPADVNVTEVDAVTSSDAWTTIAWIGSTGSGYAVQSERVAARLIQPPQPATTENSSSSLSGLAMAVDDQGNSAGVWKREAATYQLRGAVLDSVGPVTTMSQPSATRQTNTSFTIARSAVDRWSPVTSKTTYVRAAPWNGAFGEYSPMSLPTAVDETSFAGSPGYTYCFYSTAKDAVNNYGPPTPVRCTATPVDDRMLTQSGGWYRGTSSTFYQGTYTRHSTAGATLTRTGVQARHLALLVGKCPTCGKVRVYWNNVLQGTYNLAATTTLRKQLVSVKTFSDVETGTIKITVATSGKNVHIDGIVARRS